MTRFVYDKKKEKWCYKMCHVAQYNVKNRWDNRVVGRCTQSPIWVQVGAASDLVRIWLLIWASDLQFHHVTERALFAKY